MFTKCIGFPFFIGYAGISTGENRLLGSDLAMPHPLLQELTPITALTQKLEIIDDGWCYSTEQISDDVPDLIG